MDSKRKLGDEEDEEKFAPRMRMEDEKEVDSEMHVDIDYSEGTKLWGQMLETEWRKMWYAEELVPRLKDRAARLHGKLLVATVKCKMAGDSCPKCLHDQRDRCHEAWGSLVLHLEEFEDKKRRMDAIQPDNIVGHVRWTVRSMLCKVVKLCRADMENALSVMESIFRMYSNPDCLGLPIDTTQRLASFYRHKYPDYLVRVRELFSPFDGPEIALMIEAASVANFPVLQKSLVEHCMDFVSDSKL